MGDLKLQTMLALRRTGNLLSCGGRCRIPQKLLWYFLRRVDVTVSVSDFDDNLAVNLHLTEHMQRRIFWLGYYNLQIVPFLKDFLQPGMTFIDIGANIGEISLVAAKRVGYAGHVIAFEPIDAIADEFQANAERNELKQISIARTGLSEVAGDRVPIYVSCGQGNPGDKHNGLGSLYGAATGASPLQYIETTTLDAWLDGHPVDRVDLIKIDIEGAELPCLKGAQQTLQRFKPAIIIELQDTTAITAGYRATDILEYLTGLGYTFHRFEDSELAPFSKSTPLKLNQNILCTATGIPS
ncbi:MAG TPA: FkbM family methyltransferase [Rhodanobacteraceae bacterium]|nr:FkbM family methyltransferase [Rhodanobacteraceae bacterium]